jgi:ferredoxin
MGIVAASHDPFHLDMSLAYVMGVDGDRLPTTKAARRLGLVDCSVSDIKIVGDITTLDEARVRGFKLPSPSSTEWSIPEPVRRFLKDSLTTRPDVDVETCVLCGMCVSTCPAHAMSDSTGEVVIGYRKCIRCYCCQEICPEGAIGVREGWLLKLMG